MSIAPSILEQFRASRHLAASKRVVAGFDGFVDRIVTPVSQRFGSGIKFVPVRTMAEFGQRIIGAAGRSTNIELFPRMEKLGGNGPIMANALLTSGIRVKYLGALGETHPVPALVEFAARSEGVTLCDPGLTTALEFSDGKLMLGLMEGFDGVTYARIVERVGGETVFQNLIAGADLVSLLNWTMLPHMTEIFRAFVEKLLPNIPAHPNRLFFFDLADPEKRADSELADALRMISRFETFGHVTLGLNFKEGEHVGRLLGIAETGETEHSLRAHAKSIRDILHISTVVIHPRKSAACATADGTAWVLGPYCDTPLVTTGAGDHFNAGFALGQLLGLTPEACLATGVATSGLYVRSGNSPTLDELETFLGR